MSWPVTPFQNHCQVVLVVRPIKCIYNWAHFARFPSGTHVSAFWSDILPCQVEHCSFGATPQRFDVKLKGEYKIWRIYNFILIDINLMDYKSWRFKLDPNFLIFMTLIHKCMCRPANQAALAQLGERQTEDLKAPCSIHGGGKIFRYF